MSHPNPTFDPSEHGYTEDEVARAEARMEAQIDREAERHAENYDVIRVLSHARNDDLKEIAEVLPASVKARFIRYLND